MSLLQLFPPSILHFLQVTGDTQRSLMSMPSSLKHTMRRMMSKGKKSERPSREDVVSFDDMNSRRTSTDSFGSVSSRTYSAHNSPPPFDGLKQASQRPTSHEHWSDGVAQDSYTYLLSKIDESNEMATNLYQRPVANSAPGTDSIRTTRRSVQPPAVTEQERTASLASPTLEFSAQVGTPYSKPRDFEGEPNASAQSTNMPDAVTEEEEEEAIQHTKREIRRLKVLDVKSITNALRLAHQAFKVGSRTLQTLHEQGDRLQNAEENLGRASIGNKDAARKFKELKQADRMVSMSDPFTKAKHERNTEIDMLAARRHDRKERDAIRAADWQAWRVSQAHVLTNVPRHQGATREDVLARAKYQFEDDSDDERMEDIIEGNIDELLAVVQGMKGIALATSAQVNHQNEGLDRTRRLADRVDDELALNQARLDRFK